MIEELKEEKLIEKVGGRFRLSSLIQKRLVFMNKGSAPYVETNGVKDKLQLVVQEILEDKIYLGMDDELVENPSGLPYNSNEQVQSEPAQGLPRVERTEPEAEENPFASAFTPSVSSNVANDNVPAFPFDNAVDNLPRV